jgi:predicted regulator of Ras-like GTPase activity (Roadblock/LC7/MglB family)
MEKVKDALDGTWSSLPGGLPPVKSPSAPTWPVPTPPTPQSVAVAPDPQSDPTLILDELVDTVDGVRSAILASVDGFGLARSRSMGDEASHPAMLAAAVGLAHQLVAMSGGDRLRQLVVDHDGGLLLVWPIGDQRVLAILASPTIEQRNARSFVRARHAALLGAKS